MKSIEWAAAIGVDRLVVHLGQVSDVPEMFEEELEMRRMFDGPCRIFGGLRTGVRLPSRAVSVRRSRIAIR